MKKQARGKGSDFFVTLWDTKKECPIYLRKNESIYDFLFVEYLVVDFTNYSK